jgi:photosystem II stability/assembly factor-like uncharacterized protein
VSAPSPFTGVPGSLNTSLTTLQVAEPATLWGWGHTLGAGGTSNDRLAVSADLGQTWQQADVATTARVTASTYSGANLLDAWMTDAQHAWIITQDASTGTASLKKTETGLSNLAVVSGAPADATNVRFFTATTGILVAGKGGTASTWAIYRTTDGGTTWQPVGSSLAHQAGDKVYSATLLGSTLWLTTAKGQLLRTTDAGLTWTITDLPTGGVAGQLAFRDAANGLLLATNNTLYGTTDGGQSWQAVAGSGPRRAQGLVAVPGSAGTYLSFDGVCAAACTSKGSAVSVDNGLTWRELENTIYHTAMAAQAGNRAWSAGYNRANLYTTSNVVLGTTAARPVAAERPWPNPATGYLNFAAEAQSRQVTLYDAVGRRQASYTLPAQATRLELTGCAPGLYLLQYPVQGRPYATRLVVATP